MSIILLLFYDIYFIWDYYFEPIVFGRVLFIIRLLKLKNCCDMLFEFYCVMFSLYSFLSMDVICLLYKTYKGEENDGNSDSQERILVGRYCGLGDGYAVG